MVKKRLIPVLAVVGLAIVATSCGSDGAQSSPSSDSTLPPVATGDPATGGYTHPTGVDDVVISYAELGGFTTPAVTFQQTPAVLVPGDGRVFSPGAQIEIYPGPLLPAVQVQTITEPGIQNLLAAADDAGLLADIDYTIDSNVADASTATVVISADGDTWTHEAYALGFAGPDGVEPTPERQASPAFVTQLTELSKLAGAENLGETALFEPTEYAIEATPVDDLSALQHRWHRAHARGVAGRRVGQAGRHVELRDAAGDRNRRAPHRRQSADVLHRRRRHVPGRRSPRPPRLHLLSVGIPVLSHEIANLRHYDEMILPPDVDAELRGLVTPCRPSRSRALGNGDVRVYSNSASI